MSIRGLVLHFYVRVHVYISRVWISLLCEDNMHDYHGYGLTLFVRIEPSGMPIMV